MLMVALFVAPKSSEEEAAKTPCLGCKDLEDGVFRWLSITTTLALLWLLPTDLATDVAAVIPSEPCS